MIWLLLREYICSVMLSDHEAYTSKRFVTNKFPASLHDFRNPFRRRVLQIALKSMVVDVEDYCNFLSEKLEDILFELANRLRGMI